MTRTRTATSLFLTVSALFVVVQGCNTSTDLQQPPQSTDGGSDTTTGGSPTVGTQTTGGSTTTPGATGGTVGNTGGAGNNNTGGTPGNPQGGAATGGRANTGGTPGNPQGGGATGGSPVATGGSPVVGATGGSPVGTATGGSPVVGAGGTTATAAGGSALTSCTPSGTLAVQATNNFVTVGTCSGYPFTFTNTGATATGTATVSPVCGATGCTPAFTGTGLCATGSVPVDPASASVAGVGFNLLQTQSGNPSLFALSGSSVTISFTNTGGAPLRAQFTADTTGTLYWCYDLTGKTSPQTIPLSSFNQTCWTPTTAGAFVPGTSKILAFELQVPSNTTTATSSFNVCLTGLSVP